MVMDEEIQRLPSRDEWLDQPVPENEWLGKGPPPNKREFFEWLHNEIGITDYNIQLGLWKNIMFSSAWLTRDDRERPSNKEFRNRIAKLERHIHAIESVLHANEDSNHIDSWLKYTLVTAQIDKGLPNAINSIEHNLRLLRLLLEHMQSYLDRRRAGPRKDDTLWDWVEALSLHIEILTDLEITVDFQNGEPVSKYAMLVYKAVELLDKSRLDQVENVLRRYRTAHNREKDSTN